MTDAQRRVAELVHSTPVVPLTARQRRYRVVAVLFALVAIAALLAALAGLWRIGQVAACTNANLGARNAPIRADQAAHIRWADNVLAALTGREDKRALVAHTRHYAATLAHDQHVRTTHPLGHC